MNQLIAARIIELPLKLTMANTCNIFAVFAVTFLTFLSLSSAFVNQDFDNLSSKHFEKNFNQELQPFLREKRADDNYLVKKHDPLELEELESQIIHDRRAIVEETKKLNHKDDKKNEELRTNNETEEDAKDDIFSYRSMHDLIQAFILADEQDIAMRLQQLREIENATESEKLSNLPKRQASASASAAAAATSNLLGSNLWDTIPLTDLDAHSCESEAYEYGHVHDSGLIVHEFFCELRKLWHYFLIIVRNLKAGLTLGPLIVEGVVEGGHGILNVLFHHIPRLLHTVIRAPHHLLMLPDIIRDAVPFPSITGAIRRLIRVVFKVIHFVRELLWGHIRHVLGHFFHLHHLGSQHLRESLLDFRPRLHHLCKFGSTVPLEEEIVSGSSATINSGAIVVPDYQRSLAELLSSLRGVYDGYHASGIPHLIRTGVKSISTSSAYSKVTSYLSNVPSYLNNIGSYLSKIPSLNNFGGYTPVEQDTTVTMTSTSSASSSVGSPIRGPVVEPVIASQAPIETVSSLASASVVETQPMVSSAPLISTVPNIFSSMPVPSSSAASAAATAAATSAAVAATSAASTSPVVSSYRTVPRIYAPALAPIAIEESAVPCAPLESAPISSEIISQTIENTVSESNPSGVNIFSPEIAVPGVSENAAAAASASTSTSLASNIGLANNAGLAPLNLPYSLNRYRSKPILSAIRPTSAASASSSASVSSSGNLIEPGQYRGLDLNLDRKLPLRPRIYPASLSSAALSSASASQNAMASSASSASSVSSSNLNFILPRENIIGALGHNYLTPGDIILITLKNNANLIGRVQDAINPISFSFLKPKLRASLLHHGGRVWKLSPRDFRDPECIRRLNSPLLLRHTFLN